VVALYMDGLVPAQAHKLRDSAGIIAIGPVAHRRQRNVRVARLDHEHLKTAVGKLYLQPRAKGARLNSDTAQIRDIYAERLIDRGWFARHFALVDYATLSIHHTH